MIGLRCFGASAAVEAMSDDDTRRADRMRPRIGLEYIGFSVAPFLRCDAFSPCPPLPLSHNLAMLTRLLVTAMLGSIAFQSANQSAIRNPQSAIPLFDGTSLSH